MKYTGRVSIIIFVLLIRLVWVLYYYHFYAFKIHWYELSLTLLFMIPAWWLGKQFDKAKYLSEKDVLTQVYNRRFILAVMPKLLSQMKRINQPFTIFMIDCNEFKKVNDELGHQMGDRILLEVASVLRKSTRESDIVGRWGGDEFIIIAPFTDRKGAEVISNRIHHVANTTLKHSYNVTLAIGFAVCPDDTENLEELIDLADQNMYDNKFSAKNTLMKGPICKDLSPIVSNQY